jgi:tetratricopeptide (TPR) repeat protein
MNTLLLRIATIGFVPGLLFSLHCGPKPVLPPAAETPESAYSRGNRLMDQGDHDRAEDAFERARVLKPDYAPAYEGLSRAAFARGQVDEAIKQLNRARMNDPDFVPIYITTGKLYQSVKRYADAIAQYREGLRRDPDRLWAVDTWFHLGDALEQSGRPEEAYDAYFRALELEPLHLEARNRIQRLRASLGPAFLRQLQYENRLDLFP